MNRTRSTLGVTAALLSTALLTGCSALGIGGAATSCTETLNSITAAGTTAKDSIESATTHFTKGDVDDPAASSTVADDFTSAGSDMAKVAGHLDDLADISSGDVATSARDASKKWTIAANDYADLAQAVTEHDAARTRTLAGTASADMTDSSAALQTVIAALGSRIKDGADGCR